MRCGLMAWQIFAVHVHNNTKWDKVCRGLMMTLYLSWFAQQADEICGDGNQAWYFGSNEHQSQTTDADHRLHIEPLSGLINTVADFEAFRAQCIRASVLAR